MAVGLRESEAPDGNRGRTSFYVRGRYSDGKEVSKHHSLVSFVVPAGNNDNDYSPLTVEDCYRTRHTGPIQPEHIGCACIHQSHSHNPKLAASGHRFEQMQADSDAMGWESSPAPGNRHPATDGHGRADTSDLEQAFDVAQHKLILPGEEVAVEHD